MTNEQALWVVARALQSATPQTNSYPAWLRDACAVLRSIGVEIEVLSRSGVSEKSDRERASLRRRLDLPEN